MAHCPECDALVDIDADEVEEGQLVSCPECGTDLEVVNTNPVELEVFEEDEEEEEDFEEEDFEEEEEDFEEDEEDEEY